MRLLWGLFKLGFFVVVAVLVTQWLNRDGLENIQDKVQGTVQNLSDQVKTQMAHPEKAVRKAAKFVAGD